MSNATTVISDPRTIAVHYNNKVRLASRNAVSDEIRWRLDEIRDNLDIPLHLTVCSIPKVMHSN